MEFASPITPKDNTFSEEMQMDMISKKLANDRLYAYHGGRFWFWDEGRSIWKESHLLAKKYNLDAIHDTVHEMARDEARHGKAFEGLLNRYFGK